MTRGERDRNPGNLRDANIPWQGLIGRDDKGFCIFDTASNGIRALAKTLLTYQRKHGLDNVKAIISRYAPSTENDTNAYVEAVCKAVGMSPMDPFNFDGEGGASFLVQFVTAIIKHENGGVVYTPELIHMAVNGALA